VRVMERVAARMNRERIPHDIRYTVYAGHAVELARSAVSDGYTQPGLRRRRRTVGERAAAPGTRPNWASSPAAQEMYTTAAAFTFPRIP
jgi:hypothetical protein